MTMPRKYLKDLHQELMDKADDDGFTRIHIDITTPLILELLRAEPHEADAMETPVPLDTRSLALLLAMFEVQKDKNGYTKIHKIVFDSMFTKLLRMTPEKEACPGACCAH